MVCLKAGSSCSVGHSYQSTLRMLHYYATEQSEQGMWRAGAHTDFDCLTLLFQRSAQENPA
jgi:isopenicillin N synthase-like dioxygenase